MLEWFRKYHTEICWWIMGWLTFAVLDCLKREDYLLALANAGLIWLNHYLWKRSN